MKNENVSNSADNCIFLRTETLFIFQVEYICMFAIKWMKRFEDNYAFSNF